MRRRPSTRSVIKLLAAAAVATASIVGLVRLSTPPARGELPLCEDIEEIDTNVLIKVAVLAMAMAAMAVRRWRRANAEVRRWRRARDHTS